MARQSKALAQSKILTRDIWPQERDLLFRPDRWRYVRKIIRPKGCVFCAASKADQLGDHLLLYRSRAAMVVLNKFPYNTGHCLILPRRHHGEFTSLRKSEHDEIHFLLRESIRILGRVYKPSGFNVGLNLGAAAGAGIPEHLHYHVLPRWSGDTNFFPLLADTKVVVESLEQSLDRLLPYFKKLKVT